MITRQEVVEKALELGFADIGFATVEPFESQRAILAQKREEYAWTAKVGLDLERGIDPKVALAEAKTIIVVVEAYFRQAFPAAMEAHFGRVYLDDDRKTKDRSARRMKAFREFLSANGIASKVPGDLPHRLSAARAGLGTFGKNCLFFARQGALGASWTTPIPLVVDAEFPADPPSIGFGCPDWCKNACVAACPTKALKGGGKIDPRQCISYLSYRGAGITPLELREPMGLWVYGCDRCQNVCPRNAHWLAAQREPNPKVAAMAEDFQLVKLLHMDREYYLSRVFPHMFYMPAEEMWRWKMNVARVMGNTLDRGFVPELVRAFRENSDERICGMVAWALGRLGGVAARGALEGFLPESSGAVREEIRLALAALEKG